MSTRFYNPNLGLHPADPAYDNTFDEAAMYEYYESASIARAEGDR